MKPVLLIDFYKTLSFDLFWSDKFRSQADEILFSPDSNLVNDWMRGEYTSEEINNLISEKTKIDYRELWSDFVSVCENLSVDRNALEQVSKLSDKFLTVIATDNMDSFTRFTVPALGLDNHFDLISNSFERRKLKGDNDGEVFLDIIRELDGDITRSVLCDDNVGNCANFEKLGGRAHVISPANSLLKVLQSI